MKKSTFLLGLLVTITLFSSCKKEYSCVCVTTLQTSTEEITTTQTVAMDSKMKESQATAACAQTEVQLNSFHSTLVEDENNEYESAGTACELE